MKVAFPARLVAACIVAVTCYCGAPAALGASDYFLKIDGVDGESKLERGAIDILAYSHDVKSPREAGSGLATGRRQYQPLRSPDSPPSVDMSDISFSCPLDKASPQLMLACATGQHIKSAVLTCRKQGTDHTYMKITMEDCLISSYSSSGASSDEVPMETFSLNFSKITFEFPSSGPGDGILVKFVIKK